VKLPAVTLTEPDFDIIFRHGQLSSVEVLPSGMAKLLAAGYDRRMRVNLEVQQNVRDNTVLNLVVTPLQDTTTKES
jgi:hypothetical protein